MNFRGYYQTNFKYFWYTLWIGTKQYASLRSTEAIQAPGLTICKTFCKDSILKCLDSIYLFSFLRFKIILWFLYLLTRKNTEEKKSPFSAIVSIMTFFLRSLPISCEIILFSLMLYVTRKGSLCSASLRNSSFNPCLTMPRMYLSEIILFPILRKDFCVTCLKIISLS